MNEYPAKKGKPIFLPISAYVSWAGVLSVVGSFFLKSYDCGDLNVVKLYC